VTSICASVLREFKAQISLPGILIIDTPGHAVFSNLRVRGGSIADIAILVIDILKGVEEQTKECIEILKSRKTPFVVAANKIDRIPGWKSVENKPFLESYASQDPIVKQRFDELLYRLIGDLAKFGFASDRFDRIRDFTRTVAIVPTSALTGEGIPELLAIICGLVQHYLMKRLSVTGGPGKGVVLEVREERGLGNTIDVILYVGMIMQGDTIVVGGLKKPIITKVRALLLPKPLHEIRDPEDRFLSVNNVTAAAGVKIAAQDLEKALAGAPVRVVGASERLEDIVKEVSEEVKGIRFTKDIVGVIVKTDTLGSLEALVDYLRKVNIPVRVADVGHVSKRDVFEASISKKSAEQYGVILAFNVKVLPEAEKEALDHGVTIFTKNIVYRLIEDYQQWLTKLKEEEQRRMISQLIHPGKIRILPGYVFRRSDPAIVGVEVLAGKIKPGYPLMKASGGHVGSVMQIQESGKPITEATAGMKVVISRKGDIIIGRQIKEGEVLYVAVPEKHLNALDKFKDLLSPDELSLLEEFKLRVFKERFLDLAQK